MVVAGRSPARRRTFAVVASVVVAVALTATVFAACSGDKNTDDQSSPTTAPRPEGSVELEGGRAKVFAVNEAPALSKKVRSAVLAGAQNYTDRGVIAPLVEGKLGDNFGKLFTGPVKARAIKGGPDHAALTDEGVPQADGKVDAKASKVAFNAMAGADGKLMYVTASFRLNLTVPTEQGPIKIKRTTELTFQPEGGKWRISAYRVGVNRTTGAGSSSTTADTTSTTEASS